LEVIKQIQLDEIYIFVTFNDEAANFFSDEFSKKKSSTNFECVFMERAA
jgi:hypothetical protein